MNFLENLKMAYNSIIGNKMRSFLTMLGIIIGISSVIAIVSLGQGGQNSINDQINQIGAANLNITIDPTQANSSDYFTLEDIKNLKDRVNTIRYASPTATKRATVGSPLKSKTAILFGGNEDLADINSYNIIDGRFFNSGDINSGKQVAVLDELTAKDLFGFSNAVGSTITLSNSGINKTVNIIGIIASSSMFGKGNSKMPSFIYVPINVIQSLYTSDFNMDTLSIMATSKDNVEAAGNSALHVLSAKHNNKDRQVYTATSVLSQTSQITNVLKIFTTFITAVAGISLVVGGIGVMNIMLVSVTERTREIGLRKSIGATTNSILLQFLTEAVIISLIGGLIGMALGIGISSLIGYFINIVPTLSIASVILAILFSCAVGIFFGIYPARKAAMLDPIDALRYE
ncbi:MAG TPA: ABC transporter permease [Clostridiaceae bacterium]